MDGKLKSARNKATATLYWCWEARWYTRILLARPTCRLIATNMFTRFVHASRLILTCTAVRSCAERPALTPAWLPAHAGRSASYRPACGSLGSTSVAAGRATAPPPPRQSPDPHPTPSSGNQLSRSHSRGLPLWRWAQRYMLRPGSLHELWVVHTSCLGQTDLWVGWRLRQMRHACGNKLCVNPFPEGTRPSGRTWPSVGRAQLCGSHIPSTPSRHWHLRRLTRPFRRCCGGAEDPQGSSVSSSPTWCST